MSDFEKLWLSFTEPTPEIRNNEEAKSVYKTMLNYYDEMCEMVKRRDREIETLEEQIEKLKEEISMYIDTLKYSGIRNKELSSELSAVKEIRKYLEGLIEWCDCGKPKADCICIDKNGWHKSREYLLQEENKKLRELYEMILDFDKDREYCGVDINQWIEDICKKAKEIGG